MGLNGDRSNREIQLVIRFDAGDLPVVVHSEHVLIQVHFLHHVVRQSTLDEHASDDAVACIGRHEQRWHLQYGHVAALLK